MKKNTLLQNPRRFTETIARSDMFLDANTKENLSQSERLHLGIRLGSQALSETLSHEAKADSLVYRLISTINDYAKSQATLNEQKEKYASRMERLPHLRKVIEFNHAVKDLVNYEPTLAFNDLLSFITSFYAGTNHESPEQISWFESHVRASLDGMRHELAYEQILGQAQLLNDDLEYDENTTVDDELHGVDYYIKYGEKKFGIDIKSSHKSCENARQKSNNPEFIVWSHLSWEDFENTFRISTQLAKNKARLILNDLEDAELAA